LPFQCPPWRLTVFSRTASLFFAAGRFHMIVVFFFRLYGCPFPCPSLIFSTICGTLFCIRSMRTFFWADVRSIVETAFLPFPPPFLSPVVYLFPGFPFASPLSFSPLGCVPPPDDFFPLLSFFSPLPAHTRGNPGRLRRSVPQIFISLFSQLCKGAFAPCSRPLAVLPQT